MTPEFENLKIISNLKGGNFKTGTLLLTYIISSNISIVASLVGENIFIHILLYLDISTRYRPTSNVGPEHQSL